MPRRREEQAAYLPVSQKRLHSFYQSSRSSSERTSERGEIGGGKQGDGRRVAYNFTVKIINYLPHSLAPSLRSRLGSRVKKKTGVAGQVWLSEGASRQFWHRLGALAARQCSARSNAPSAPSRYVWDGSLVGRQVMRAKEREKGSLA